MDDWMLSAIALVVLSCVFGSYGIVTLVEAYRAGNLGPVRDQPLGLSDWTA